MTTYERTAYRNSTRAPATVIVDRDLADPDHQVQHTVTVLLSGVEHSATADERLGTVHAQRAFVAAKFPVA